MRIQNAYLRLLDLVFSITGIILTLPVMFIIFALSYAESGSPIFFQKRVGKNQREFTLIKFRTMKINTPSVGTHLVNASSTTKLGRILRKTKLDELPQLFNVLIGNMSLVGPRPGLPNQKNLTVEREKREVFSVRPGITGLAQIKKVDMSTPKKLALYDSVMIKNLNIYLYMKLILATLLGDGGGDRIK